MKLSLVDIAERLMTCGITEKEILDNFDYRKGKTFQDIKLARVKAAKNGHYKLEYEIGMCEVYLAQVLKSKRRKE